MRPLRFLLSVATCIVAFFLLLYVGPWRVNAQESLDEQRSIGTYFSWRAPSSLFPPSAIISLTDDNSTFFLARPAAFGPLIPVKSLSGQLWIGSGFGDDRLGRTGPEGELGCSDVPGWSDGSYANNGKSLIDAKTSWSKSQESQGRSKRKRDVSKEEDEDEDEDEEVSEEQPNEDDGTDDHLHHPLPASDGLRTNGGSAGNTKKPTHADIQSLQESAEIAGKVVLLSRGGCGFLEKVKWVQRRGGVALIVGDDIRGGPLVTMYARGDTSNVTIPSLFTSYTTAHLLSSLIPSGGVVDGIHPEEAARLGLALGDTLRTGNSGGQNGNEPEKPNFTTTTVAVKATPSSKAPAKVQKEIAKAASYEKDESDGDVQVGWFGSLLGRGKYGDGDAQRPPNSGHLGWVLQQTFEEDDDQDYRDIIRKATTSTSTIAPTKTPDRGSGDGFVIGIQDWRDPDLVAQQKEQLEASTSGSTASSTAQTGKATHSTGPKGGSITPGSGEYAKGQQEPAGAHDTKTTQADSTRAKDSSSKERSRGWLSRLLRSDDKKQIHDSPSQISDSTIIDTAAQRASYDHKHTANRPELHEGLWVTITPTSMSSSPFFDTLLVLVVSPLVTLTVVYALLLLRSRIRRRRWRAPKSVVERLPVRTYQTMPTATTTSSSTPSLSSLTAHTVSVTTPLLTPSNARPITARPRSRTTPEVPLQAGSPLRSDSMASPSLEQIEEKRAAGLSEWRRRYGGKQRECVVCLEEYIDGVSRVMSLPCGHEFHAECITPWLTTRRRTCPICKGDVVRSLAKSSPVQHEVEAAEEDEEDVQEQAAVARNDDPAAQQPVSREDEAFEDLERGLDRTR